MSRTIFYGPKDVRAIEVRLYGTCNPITFADALSFIRDDRDGGVKEEITISEKTVSKVYPGIFKTTEEQKELFDRYTSSFYYNRTAVTERFKSSIQCALICGEGSFASRRKKRVAGDNNIYHGCCMS